MSPVAFALLVVVWYGHDFPPQTLPAIECEQAREAINTAAQIRDKLYAVDSEVSTYCVPLNQGVDPVIYALLERPVPRPRPPKIPLLTTESPFPKN